MLFCRRRARVGGLAVVDVQIGNLDLCNDQLMLQVMHDVTHLRSGEDVPTSAWSSRTVRAGARSNIPGGTEARAMS